MCINNSPECPECWFPAYTYRPAPDAPYVGAHRSDDMRAPEAPTGFDADVRERFAECEALLLRKHKDYGPSNIANAPGGPLNGLRVRMHDKLARINHLIDTGVEPTNESLRDSFVDLANYGVIACMVLDDAWPSA